MVRRAAREKERDGADASAPPQRQRLAVLEPVGEVFVNGLASWYDDEFPSDAQCAQLMSRDEFASAMTKINEALTDHWPCVPLTAFAYGCCVCTLGLSFYCATTQVEEAEQRAHMQIRRVNEQENFQRKGIAFRLVRVWYKRQSYIEITYTPGAHRSASDSSDSALRHDMPPQEREQESQRAPVTETMSDRFV